VGLLRPRSARGRLQAKPKRLCFCSLVTHPKSYIGPYTMFHKSNPVLNCPELRQMLTDFQKIFTLGLSSECVMNSSLQILPHLKLVATLTCETLMFKKWSKSTFTHQLQFVCHKIINWIILSSGIWSSLVISAEISHYHFDIFCWSLSFPRAVSTMTFCASFAAPSQKLQ